MSIAVRFALGEAVALLVFAWLSRAVLRARWPMRGQLLLAVFPLLALVAGLLSALVANFADGEDWLFVLANVPLSAVMIVVICLVGMRVGRSRREPAPGAPTAP